MSTVRALSKHTRSMPRAMNPRAGKPMNSRAFHSPFAVLSSSSSSSPLTSPPAPQSNISSVFYEKQVDVSPEPHYSSSGQRMYVVSEPDPANTPYQVPSGAYPTSAPYVNFAPTDPPAQKPRSSTSSSFAHPYLSRAAPQNESGVMESAAVRHREAPGELHQRGGSYGGLGLMDAATTTKGEGELASRNPQPDDAKVAGKFSALGLEKAWKARK
ncbi:hypothetical protein NLI96_g8465 [Meripilus lineatus]|uniref:Uncharacterized protein n=1 Tax=Meripilus lineatus TaxID=2056292 RepID=A0AAD5YBZ3_9APHY|nr:hypothetical protein NLI96_g8465 [Physisporinus lineatus]